jgi:hypothetical protein
MTDDSASLGPDDVDQLARRVLTSAADPTRDEVDGEGWRLVLGELSEYDGVRILGRVLVMAAALVREVGRSYDLSVSEVVEAIEIEDPRR